MTDVAQLHERWQTLLPNAHAESCQVVATFLDIRSFSTFATHNESFDVAIYLRSVYQRVLSEVFPKPDFFKPTGDGLLVIHHTPPIPEDLPLFVSSVLDKCVSLVQDFGRITVDDVTINFPVPQQLGIGVARGSATRLVSDSLVLDYTGRCLNLAARLMDKARPSGVVFADPLSAQLITEELAPRFSADHVYIRGIAENEPITVSITSDVKLSPTDREPISHTHNTWGENTPRNVGDVLRYNSLNFPLPRAPQRHESAFVQVAIPGFNNYGTRDGTTSYLTIPGTVKEVPDGWVVHIQLKSVNKILKDKNIPRTVLMLWGTLPAQTQVIFTPFIKPNNS